MRVRASRSDDVLRYILAGNHGVHVRHVGRAGHEEGRAVTAVLRYELALLARSHRWLPPALLYAVLVAVGSGAVGQMTLANRWGGAAQCWCRPWAC